MNAKLVARPAAEKTAHQKAKDTVEEEKIS
jgi:hypothetical protein